MTLPNFIIFGVARCGSTAFYEYIGQHPEVFMCNPKEPHFFSFEGETLDFRGPADATTINRYAVTGLADYQRLFDSAGSAKAIGEASIDYAYYPKAVEGIKRRIPGAKLICILRNPADRAFSAYSLMRARMFEPIHDFDLALKEEERRIAANWHHIWHYRGMSFYYPQLKRFFDAFPRDQVRVYIYEDFRRAPLPVVRDAYEFLGVDPAFVPAAGSHATPGGFPKSTLLQRALMAGWQIRHILRPFLPNGMARRVWRRLNAANLDRGGMRPETREMLLADFREDILRTQELLRRDLGHWLKPPDVGPTAG